MNIAYTITDLQKFYDKYNADGGGGWGGDYKVQLCSWEVDGNAVVGMGTKYFIVSSVCVYAWIVPQTGVNVLIVSNSNRHILTHHSHSVVETRHSGFRDQLAMRTFFFQ